ncbi:MAG: ABC transporter substrate-binding protein [Acidobacteriia bacterium]|nr:ABC transporter substrate-binding protein [Terriglobia bacterium]
MAQLGFIGCGSHPRDPKTLVFLLESSPVSLDPRIGTDAFSERLYELLFNSLVRRDSHANLVPDLAESWQMPDPLTYVFHLRKDVRFHDGRLLTSRDIRYTFHSILDGEVKTAKRDQFVDILNIDTPDPFTVVITLRSADVNFLWNVSLGQIGIVPENSDTRFADHPIGTGPFEFETMHTDQDVILKRNPFYFGGPPRLERLEFKIVPEAIVRALEMRKGSADMALNELTPDMVRTLQSDRQLQVIEEPGTTYKYLAFNLQDRILQNVKVRKAIAYAIDIPAIIKYLWRDQGIPASGILPPSVWAYEPHVELYPHNLPLARRLLDEAGYPVPPKSPSAPRFTLTYKTSTEELSRLEAIVIQQQLREAGIQVEIRSFEFATFYSDIIQGRFQLFSLRWIGDNLNPQIFESVFYSKNIPPGGKNRGHYSNPRLDELIEKSRSEMNQEVRKQYYSEIQKILADDLPYISLWYVNNVCIANRRVKDIHLTPSGDFDFLKDVWLDANQ